MSDPKANQEPSMEEILASIRRIISEDDEPESANKTAAPQPAAEPPAKAEKEEPEEVSAEIVDMAPPAADPDPDDEPLDLTQLAPMDDDVLELTQMADDTETAEPPTGLEAGSADDGSDMADTDKTPDVAEDDDEFNLGAMSNRTAMRTTRTTRWFRIKRSVPPGRPLPGFSKPQRNVRPQTGHPLWLSATDR